MTRKNYINKVTALIKIAAKLNRKARAQGISSLEEEVEDQDDKDFRQGLYFIIDQRTPALIDEYFSNKINFEKDKYTRLYKTVLKRAILGIQEGINTYMLFYVLTSNANLTEEEEKKIMSETTSEDFDSMNRTAFIGKYAAFMKEVLPLAEKARRDGLLSLTADIEKVKERDIFEYGMKLAIDGTAPEIIGIILNNIIAQEKDEYTHLYKVIQNVEYIKIEIK